MHAMDSESTLLHFSFIVIRNLDFNLHVVLRNSYIAWPLTPMHVMDSGSALSDSIFLVARDFEFNLLVMLRSLGKSLIQRIYPQNIRLPTLSCPVDLQFKMVNNIPHFDSLALFFLLDSELNHMPLQSIWPNILAENSMEGGHEWHLPYLRRISLGDLAESRESNC